jgi:hypothetical protein
MTVTAKFSRTYVSLEDPEAEDGSRNGAGNGHLFLNFPSIGPLDGPVNLMIFRAI